MAGGPPCGHAAEAASQAGLTKPDRYLKSILVQTARPGDPDGTQHCFLGRFESVSPAVLEVGRLM